ncbi:hypothetical protein IU501_35455 [Nocardia otitidiscaviarum]|uniref:hypothetical protein n=1 Tax=Nocardia otitidiscaviarum TaxID=1823 RepID=UPI001895C2DA|nr:hypothetical protein [Nocardia otitidiscaviarum]MBF6138272.1 hypothetical protein [Nocardia otitidiscaviarum]MCP9625221.1 hypothetical protein [Nocardia otitidiscaviarum]
MRRAQLHQFVTGLVEQTWTGDNADVARAVLRDEAFGALCYRLSEIGDAADIERAWAGLVDDIDDSALDFLAERADNPAAWLASRARDAATGY